MLEELISYAANTATKRRAALDGDMPWCLLDEEDQTSFLAAAERLSVELPKDTADSASRGRDSLCVTSEPAVKLLRETYGARGASHRPTLYLNRDISDKFMDEVETHIGDKLGFPRQLMEVRSSSAFVCPFRLFRSSRLSAVSHGKPAVAREASF